MPDVPNSSIILLLLHYILEDFRFSRGRFRFNSTSKVRVAKECGLRAFNIPAETASFTVGSCLFLK